MNSPKFTVTVAPTPAYLTALAERVLAGQGLSNGLDIEIEIALFDPPEDGFVSVQPNAARTKLIYRRTDGTTCTSWAHDWTATRRHAASLLMRRATKLSQPAGGEVDAKSLQVIPDASSKIDAIDTAIRIGIFNTCMQRGMRQDAAIAIVKGTMAQLCVAAALAKGKEL
ncbi:hypothetical protein [Sphingomonas parapaucimobilis]|uniref:hypothetical protein n=1 Tax=Sphingomonas parapaucimobilis TaxID=28213 RepID=UPI003219333C